MTGPPDFKTFFADVEATIRRVFPDAEPVEAYGMQGWQVPLVEPREPVGTMDPAHFQVFPVQRSAGVTIHLWNPASYTFLEDNGGPLEEAGFEVMKGCIQWNRRGELPLDALEVLLQAARRSLEA